MGNPIYTYIDKENMDKLLYKLMEGKHNSYQVKFLRNEIDNLYRVTKYIIDDPDKANEILKKLYDKWKFIPQTNMTDNEFCYGVGDVLNAWVGLAPRIEYEEWT